MARQLEMEIKTHRQLNHTFWKLQRAIRARLESFALTPRQYGVLVHVNQQGVALTDIAEHMYSDLSTINGIVNRLEKQGFVKRERSTSDRRVVLVKLTETGRNLKNRAVPDHHAHIQELYVGFSEQELRDLQALLQRLFHSLG